MAPGLYADVDLVAAYDLVNPLGDEAEFLLSLPSTAPLRVLDIGCGTGRIAIGFSQMGHHVVGLEPSALMLDRARGRPGADAVTWVCSDAATLTVPEPVDLAVMAGHVFQVFLDDDEARTVLRRICEHLVPGGRLVFSSRNPAVREWSRWTPALSAETYPGTPLGDLTVHWEVTAVDGPRVTYATHLQIGATPARRALDTIRFRDASEIEALLGEAGLRVTARYGDWQRTPFEPSRSEIVVIATPAA